VLFFYYLSKCISIVVPDSIIFPDEFKLQTNEILNNNDDDQTLIWRIIHGSICIFYYCFACGMKFWILCMINQKTPIFHEIVCKCQLQNILSSLRNQLALITIRPSIQCNYVSAGYGLIPTTLKLIDKLVNTVNAKAKVWRRWTVEKKREKLNMQTFIQWFVLHTLPLSWTKEYIDKKEERKGLSPTNKWKRSKGKKKQKNKKSCPNLIMWEKMRLLFFFFSFAWLVWSHALLRLKSVNSFNHYS